MQDNKIISGFSGMDRNEKLSLFLQGLNDPEQARSELESYRHGDPLIQKLHDEFSENTITNFFIPYGIAPNFLINGKYYMLPMVTEESSVVAAASRSAKFWSRRGGFNIVVHDTIKNGQLHFIWNGNPAKLRDSFPGLKELLLKKTGHITSNMVKRGGGIRDISLVDKRDQIKGYFQLSADFDTRDSMGANFINSCLEEFGVVIKEFFKDNELFEKEEREVEVIMAILSNYTGDCLVTAEVSCDADELQEIAGDMPVPDFIRKFDFAMKMAETDVHRATTHNKGVFNGVDAVVIATGNDFRAVEAAGHAWAAREGRYKSLSTLVHDKAKFSMSLTLPLAVGTVGGLTGLHPLARRSLQLLGNPDARELMGIIAAAGLASNFAAVSSLITKGIQAGHMKMHLSNILNHFGALDKEREAAMEYFSNKKVGFASVEEFLKNFRRQ